MGVLDVIVRIVELGGHPEHARHVANLRSEFETRTGAFTPDNAWFEERSRAFWADAVTRGGFGRHVSSALLPSEARWLGPLATAHRGLFRADGHAIHDVWSGAQFFPNVMDDSSRSELAAATGQLFDARVVGAAEGFVIALLPGAVFHPRTANDAIATVLEAAQSADMPTHTALDALLRMERNLRALARVKPAYAYRPDALRPRALP